MANAVPVHSKKEDEPKKVEKPAPQVDAGEPVPGQDHPELGVWIPSANGWRKDR